MNFDWARACCRGPAPAQSSPFPSMNGKSDVEKPEERPLLPGGSNGDNQPRPMKKSRGYLLKTEDMSFIVGMPCATFAITALSVGMISPALRWLAYLFAALLLANAVFWIVLGLSHQGPSKDRRTEVRQKCVGLLCLAALAGGWMMGLLADIAYMDEYWRLSHGAVHKDVTASGANVAAYADASVLEFAPGTFIDTDRTIGYMEQGEVYCIAPVTGQTSSDSPMYYAAGEDCCSQRGDFKCAEAKPKDGQVLKAIVLQNDEANPYLTAIRMSKSVYNLKLGNSRIPLKFVEDTDRYINDYWHAAFITIMICAIFQGFVCIVTGVVLRNLVKEEHTGWRVEFPLFMPHFMQRYRQGL